MVQCRPMRGSRWNVRPWRAQDAPALTAALASQAGAPPERTPRSWPEAPVPTGGGATGERVGCVALAADGSPRAFVLAVRERVAMGEEERDWLRLEHVLNACPRPATLARGGALAAALDGLAGQLGQGPGEHAVAYGWPSRRAFRMGCYHGGGETVRAQHQLVLWPQAFEGGDAQGARVADVEGFAAGLRDGLDRLFGAVRAAFGALRVRDAAALERRFLAAPPAGQRTSLALDPVGVPIGVAVHRPARYHGRAVLLVVDWLEAPDRPAAGHALRAHLVERARAEGHAEVVALFPDSAPAWRAFQDASFRVLPTHDFLVARSALKPWSAARLRREWYYTASDFEGDAAPREAAR